MVNLEVPLVHLLVSKLLVPSDYEPLGKAFSRLHALLQAPLAPEPVLQAVEDADDTGVQRLHGRGGFSPPEIPRNPSKRNSWDPAQSTEGAAKGGAQRDEEGRAYPCTGGPCIRALDAVMKETSSARLKMRVTIRDKTVTQRARGGLRTEDSSASCHRPHELSPVHAWGGGLTDYTGGSVKRRPSGWGDSLQGGASYQGQVEGTPAADSRSSVGTTPCLPPRAPQGAPRAPRARLSAACATSCRCPATSFGGGGSNGSVRTPRQYGSVRSPRRAQCSAVLCECG
ncbi:hypothetical protein NDU88_001480 [Pleurodeles waltl]|uniref:Uncharacterized protein n=1 Tax=Pleurodeles waltl TaxID=8319 RepID=A0AAV7P6T3_PLEWA|nr:hypothetical protein NDU88_001480 [Pleurodeles waltl]